MQANPQNNTVEVLKKTEKVLAGNRFVSELLRWNREENQRKMPWKGEKDPYKIWLSEIILQQTRVEQGLKYYENFIRAFPDVQALAAAPEEQVFKQWEGLGYYSRCRNLIQTARYIARDLGGQFPKDYPSILQLKGIGPYTAAAVASFAYNLPHAVLDGNVFRVLSRIFGIETAIDSTSGKKQFSSLAQSILPENKASEYNQAIMDFGALVCKPSPECGKCFFTGSCAAYLSGRQDLLPNKEKTVRVRERWFNYFVLCYKDQVAVRQRREKDIWQELFEFPLIEGRYDRVKLLADFKKQFGVHGYKIVAESRTTQRLSHQFLHFQFFELQVEEPINPAGIVWVRRADLARYAFAKTLKQLISQRLR